MLILRGLSGRHLSGNLESEIKVLTVAKFKLDGALDDEGLENAEALSVEVSDHERVGVDKLFVILHLLKGKVRNVVVGRPHPAP